MVIVTSGNLINYPLLLNRLIELELQKKLEVFDGHLLSEDDHSYWAPPYWNIMKETISLGRTEV